MTEGAGRVVLVKGNSNARLMVPVLAAGASTLLAWWPIPLFPARDLSLAALPVLTAALWAGPVVAALAAGLAAVAGWALGLADIPTIATLAAAPLVAAAHQRRLHPAFACFLVPPAVALVDGATAPLAGFGELWQSVAVLQSSLNVIAAYVLVQLSPLPGPPRQQRRAGRPLTHRLFVVLAGLAAALTTAFGAWSAASLQERRVRNALDNVQFLARDVAESADLLLTQQSHALAAFGRSLALSDLGQPNRDLSDRVAAYAAEQDQLLTVLVARADGQVVAAATTRQDLDISRVTGTSVADRRYFQAPLREGKPFVSDVFKGRGFGSDLIVAVSAPVPGDGGPRGVIEGSLDLTEFERVLYGASSRHGHAIVLVDRTGHIVASQGEGIRGSGALFEPPTRLLSATDMPSALGRKLPPDGRFSAAATLEELGWSVHVMQPVSSLLPVFESQFQMVVRQMLSALVSVLLVSALLAAWLGRPLRQLSKALVGDPLLRQPGLLESLQSAPSEMRLLALTLVRAQRRQALARRLRSSEARWRIMAEIAPDAVIVIDEQSRIVFVNGAMQRLVGRESRALVGQRLEVIVPARLRARHDAGFARYLADGTRRTDWRSREIPVLRGDGQEVVVEIAFDEYVHEGRRYFAGYLRDITARKQQEAQMQRARELAESANRAKDVFLATMTHEIRTPLHGLIGTLDLLSRARLTGEAGHRLAIARASAQSLLQVANDVLDLSAIEEGRMRIDRRAFDLHELVAAVTGAFEPAMSEKGLEFSSHVAGDLPERVIGDAHRLRQILANLINNALKFTSAGRIDVTVAGSDGTVAFEVRDTGIGVPADKRDHIFERFAQADDDRGRRYEGAGLGLSISRLLAEAMGGSLVLAQTGPQGSTFRLELPLPGVAAEDFAAATMAESNGTPRRSPAAGARVLVVDDNAANRYIVEAYLRELGAEVVLADSADGGLAALRQGRFDAVLMDVQMPGKDGYQATREIRAEFGSTLPVIAMTAGAGVAERLRCHEAGLDGLMTKPFTVQDLRELLEVHLSRMPGPVTPRGPGGNAERAAPLLDESSRGSVLQRFGGRPATLRRLLEALQESIEMHLSACADAPTRPPDALLASLHALKGSAAMYGATRLQEVAARIEEALRSGTSPAELADSFEALARVGRETMAALAQRLASIS